MSLLDRPPHVVTVQPRKEEKVVGVGLSLVNDGDPSTIRCSVQSVREWSTAEEQRFDGIQLLSLRRVFSREWVGDVHALVTYGGWDFEIVGDPQYLNTGSRKTWHWEITMRRVGAEAA
jgi:hypothetical protein